MHQLFIIIPASVFLIAAIVFVIYRGWIRAGKPVVLTQKEKGVTEAIQRRKYFRAEVLESESFIVTLELDMCNLTVCRLTNISVGGVAILAIRHPIVFETGSRIKEVKVVFPSGEEIRSSAVVKYVLRTADSDWNRYGIQFTELSKAQSGIIENYVLQAEAKRFRSSEPP